MDMNEKMHNDIVMFFNSVGDYIQLEYKPKYYKAFFKEQHSSKLLNLVGEYYMGGNNVVNTAGDVVRYIQHKVWL